MENQNYVQQSFQEEISSFGEQPSVPNNNMPLAIISTILSCCTFNCIGLILGIIAIVFASQVNQKYIAQDYMGAESAAKNAKILSFIALGLFILGIIVNIIYMIMVGFSDSVTQYEEIFRNIK